MLARHPFPAVDESFYGYLLRVSQQNGFPSIWSLFSRAGLKQHESRGAGVKTSKLAAIMGHPPRCIGRYIVFNIAFEKCMSHSRPFDPRQIPRYLSPANMPAVYS
jgi:hypothetical protein